MKKETNQSPIDLSQLPSLLWVLLAIGASIFLHKPIYELASSIAIRVKQGGHAEFGPVKLQEIKVNPTALDVPPSGITVSHAPHLESKRNDVYKENEYFFIGHKLFPSEELGQTYDIYIYVVPHKKGIAEIKSVSYYFGKSWGHRVFTSKDRGKAFGVVVSAFGPMLALVTIELNDGTKVETWSYIDFENGQLGSRGGV